MLDDVHLRLVGVLGTGQSALRALARIRQRVQIAGVTQDGSTQPNANTGLVHHVEHECEPLAGFADQLRVGAALFAEIEHAIGGAAKTHLVIQPRQRHIVASGERTVVIDPELGHDEQRDAFHARRCVPDARQRQVNDVLGQVVVPAGNPHFGSDDPVGTVRLRQCGGADVRKR